MFLAAFLDHRYGSSVCGCSASNYWQSICGRCCSYQDQHVGFFHENITVSCCWTLFHLSHFGDQQSSSPTISATPATPPPTPPAPPSLPLPSKLVPPPLPWWMKVTTQLFTPFFLTNPFLFLLLTRNLYRWKYSKNLTTYWAWEKIVIIKHSGDPLDQ